MKNHPNIKQTCLHTSRMTSVAGKFAVCITFFTLTIFVLPVYGQLQLDSIIDALKLPEVTVTARKIKLAGDTVSYTAATYLGKNDKTLADLLGKMPGIEVKPDGQVVYNGQWINEFYIEGMDMLGENYGIATKNLNAGDIGSVQVMRDHQDVKMLQGVQRGSGTAMNIKLKENAKGIWSSTLQAGMGFQPNLSWDASATLMNFRRKSQNISVVKSNNIGTDLRGELGAPATFNSSYGTGLLYPDLPALDNRFVYRNQSGSASVNQLLKLSDDKMLTFNLNYLYDKEKRNAKDVTTYLADSLSRYVVEESNSAAMHQHFIGLNTVYKNNGQNRYHKNKLSVNASFPKGEGLINERILQNVSGHSIGITDAFDIHWKRAGGIGDGTLRIDFNEKEGRLRLPETVFSQRVLQRNATVSGYASAVAVTVPHLMFNLNAGFDASWQRAEITHASTVETGSDSQTTWQAGAYVSPKLLWHYGQRFQWLVYVPVGFNHYASDDGTWDYDKVFFSFKPYSNITYKYSDKLSLSLTALCEESTPTALTLMAGKRYQDYRTTVSNPNLVEAKTNRTFKSALRGDYTDVLGMLFGSLSLSYVHSRNATSSGYGIDDDMIDYFLQPFSTQGDTWQADQTFSKGFFRWNAKLSESFTIGTGKSEYSVGNAIHSGRTNYLRAQLGYVASFARWMTFDTSNEFALNKPFTDGNAATGSKYTFHNATSLVLWPVKELCLTPSVMYYHNNYSTAFRNNVFLNCNVEYTTGNAILSVQCDNLLDNRTFRRYSDNGIICSSSEYRLRGRTVLFSIRIRI